MRLRTLRAFFAVCAFGSAVRAFAADDTVSFVIAPPPVGYPEFNAGERTTEAGVNAVYLSVDAYDSSLKMYGVMGFGSFQNCVSDSLSVNSTVGGAFFTADQYDMLFMQLPVAVNIVAAPVRLPEVSLFLFGGGGLNMSLMTMTMSITQWVPYTTSYVQDDVLVMTTLLTASLTLGVQANITAGALVLSPYGLYTYSGGSYSTTMTSSMSYSYPSTSGSIDAVGSWVLGFDVLYKPLGITLSSMLQNTDQYTLVSVSLKWLVSRR